MTIIRGRDRFAAAGRRLWRAPFLIECVILAAILAVVLLTGGCLGRDLPPIPNLTPPLSRPELAAPVGTPEHAIAVLNRRIDDAEATITSDRNEVKRLQHEALVAPIRPWLHLLEVIALMGMVGGVALAVIAFCTPVSFAAKIPLWIAAGSAAVLALCLGTDWALDHLVLIGSGLGVLLAGGALWFLRHHLQVTDVLRTVDAYVPDQAPTGAAVDRLLDRVTGRHPGAKP